MSVVRRFAPLTIALAGTLTLAACSTQPATAGGSSGTSTGGGKQIKIFATTGYLGDLAKNLDPSAAITVMVKPGGDPHTYQPSTADITAMRDADVVLSNGVHLESMMLDQLKSLGDKHLPVGDKVPADKLLPWPEKDAQGNALHDPHIWNSPEIWKIVTKEVSNKLAGVEPAKKEAIAKAGEDYTKKIDDAVTKVKSILAPIPQKQRILVTGHDAFNYFGQAFDMQIKATDFVTSEANMSAAQLQELAGFIAEHKIPVIFQDNLKNPQAVKSLEESVKAKGGTVRVSDTELHADSLGDKDPVDTYLGVLTSNAETVAAALSPKKS